MQTNKPKLVLADRYAGINSKDFSNFLSKNNINVYNSKLSTKQWFV